MGNTTSESTYQGVRAAGFTYGIIFMISLTIIVLTIAIVCVRLGRSRVPDMLNVLIGFPPPRATVESQDMELGLRGSTDNSFESYPKLLYSEVVKKSDSPSSVCSSSCSICLGDYKETDTLRLLPDCGHVFHLVCVDPWLRLHSTCPMCRKSSVQTSTTIV